MSNQLVRTPIYQQLNEALRDLIRKGKFEVGNQFLTERQICEQFDVSRATANKALSNLVAEGVLEFKKGVGTFVRGGVLDYDLRSLVSFTEKAIVAGKEPLTKVLATKAIPAKDIRDSEVSQQLQLQAEDSVYYMERLRLADDVPVILEHRYVAEKFCPNLTDTEIAGSLYALWLDKFKLDIIGADQTIRALLIEDQDAEHMQVSNGAAGLVVQSVGYLSGGVPLWWERTLYRGDAYEFQNRLGPLQTARPAAGTLIDLE